MGKKYFKNNWLIFEPIITQTHFYIQQSGYFDPRPGISSNLTFVLSIIIAPFLGNYAFFLLPSLFYGFGYFNIKFPFDSGIYESSDYKQVGFTWNGELDLRISYLLIYSPKFYIYHIPFLALEHYRYSLALKDGTWEHEYKDYELLIEKKYNNLDVKIFKEKHSFTYILNNREVQERTATIWLEEREWQIKWLKWTRLFSFTQTQVAVEFDEEIGENYGSYKGRVIGCKFYLKKGETPIECLKRMEKEYKC